MKIHTYARDLTVFSLLAGVAILYLTFTLNAAEGGFTGDAYVGGNWDINTPTTCDNETVVVNGDIIINSGGSLLLDNSTVDFDANGRTFSVSAPLETINSNLTNSAGYFNLNIVANSNHYQTEFSKVQQGIISFTAGYHNLTGCTIFGASVRARNVSGYTHLSLRDTSIDPTSSENDAYYGIQILDADAHLNNISLTGPATDTFEDRLSVGLSVRYYSNFSLDNSTITGDWGSAGYQHYSYYEPISFQNNSIDVGSEHWVLEFDPREPERPPASTFIAVNCSFLSAPETPFYTIEIDGRHDAIFYNCEITGGPVRGSYQLYYWVNLSVVDAFYQTVSDARVGIYNKNLDLTYSGYTNATGKIPYIWLKVDEDGTDLNPLSFVISKNGAVNPAASYTISESREITLQMSLYEWTQSLTIQMINNYTREPIPFGELLCYLNGEYIAFEIQSISGASEINITIFDHWDRLVGGVAQDVNYSRSGETFLLYVDYVTLKIFQHDTDTGEVGTWVREFNLTLEGSSTSVHFEGDEINVPYVAWGINDYKLSWDGGQNHSAGSFEIQNISGPQYPPSSHLHNSTGFFITDIGVKTTASISSSSGAPSLLSLQWFVWLIKTPYFAILAIIGVAITWRRYIREWWVSWRDGRRRKRREKRVQKTQARGW